MADAKRLVPKEALDYLKRKKLRPAFSYKDVWNEEHAAAFTVAKAMQLDVLSDIKKAVEKAVEDGTTFEQFKKDLKPTLMQKGWWGKKDMVDPLTGKTVNAQLGSDRRLKTIYSTNLRSAFQKGQYDRAMSSDAHPYLMYHLGPSVHHREQHARWNNLIRPKDDPIWNEIFPPNGYGCKCYTTAVSAARKERYERDGVPAYDPSTGKTVRVPAQTSAPKMNYKNYFNERKGAMERIPQGITPGFNWNQGLPRDKQMENALKQKMEAQKAYLSDSSLAMKVNKDDKGQMASFIRDRYDSKVPKLEKLVKDSKSFFTTKKELQKSEKLRHVADALDHLEKNCKDAAFKKVVWGSLNLIHGGAIAVFNPYYPDAVFLNVMEFGDLPKTAKQRFDDRIISTSSPMHFVFHEAGHKWVLKHLTNRYKFIPIKWLEKSDGKWFEKNISWNAGRKPEEAVAELFAMKMAGDEIPAQAVSLIAKYAKEFAKWLY
jgi:hypothetical protein